MNKVLPYLLILWIIGSCGESKEGETVAYNSSNLQLKQLSENTWIHISYLQTNDYGKVPCNGLVYTHQGEGIVFDTPSSDSASIELISFFQNKGISIKKVVPTHFHYDCLGGLNPFHDAEILSSSSLQTFDLAVETGNVPIPKEVFEGNQSFKVGNKTVELIHFGAGHTLDNMVAYIPSEEILFGGCLVKSINAGKGNLADADTLQWAPTIHKILDTYPNLKTVIPGHGPHGGVELLSYTEDMFR